MLGTNHLRLAKRAPSLVLQEQELPGTSGMSTTVDESW